MQITFHKHHIHFVDYAFPIASINKHPDLSAQAIREVRTFHRTPPEIVTNTGEILFVSAGLKPHLRLFARINQIPDVHTLDVWDLLLEPFLDTEHSLDHYQHTLQQLNKSGFSDQEIADIRQQVQENVRSYNAMLWEWVHLGHYDLLSAYGFMNIEEPHLSAAQLAFYKWSHKIALHGIPQDRAMLSHEEKANLKIDQLIMDLTSTSPLQISQETREQIKQTLINAYTQPGRHYHNLEHILNVVDLCNWAEVESEDRAILALSAWFHDIVYDPTASNNEEKSASLMAEVLEPLNLKQHLIEKAQILILATQNHLGATDPLARYLVDADLSILAQPEDEYDNYTTAVRAEYAHLSDAVFYPARLAFLEKLSHHIQSKGRLYHHLHPLHDEMARENIQRELKRIYPRIT